MTAPDFPASDPIRRIEDQLAWRGPSGRPMGHIVLQRSEAERLLDKVNRPASIARCIFGCATPVVGIYWMPEGCACRRDQVQALCAQHAISAEPISGMVLICGPGPLGAG